MQDSSAVTGPLPQDQAATPVTPLSSKLRTSFGTAMGGSQTAGPTADPSVGTIQTSQPAQQPQSTMPLTADEPSVMPATTTVPVSPDPAMQTAPVVQAEPVTVDILEQMAEGEKLDILSAVLDQVEAEGGVSADPQSVVQQVTPTPDQPIVDQTDASVLDQALPAAVAASTDTLNPAIPGGQTVAKERVSGSDQAAVEAAASIQYVEQEPSPEIPVEVETFIQRVEDHSQTAPQEVVIADGTQEQAQAAYPSRPVVVLPITQQDEEQGQKKSPKFSIRWLIEWSHKIIKMFAGKVIYRQVEAQ